MQDQYGWAGKSKRECGEKKMKIHVEIFIAYYLLEI